MKGCHKLVSVLYSNSIRTALHCARFGSTLHVDHRGVAQEAVVEPALAARCRGGRRCGDQRLRHSRIVHRAVVELGVRLGDHAAGGDVERAVGDAVDAVSEVFKAFVEDGEDVEHAADALQTI